VKFRAHNMASITIYYNTRSLQRWHLKLAAKLCARKHTKILILLCYLRTYVRIVGVFVVFVHTFTIISYLHEKCNITVVYVSGRSRIITIYRTYLYIVAKKFRSICERCQ